MGCEKEQKQKVIFLVQVQFCFFLKMQNYSERIAAYNAANYIFDDDFRALVALLFLHKKNRKSPHKLYRQRAVEGAVNILIDRHLIDDDTKFRQYFRLSPFFF